MTATPCPHENTTTRGSQKRQGDDKVTVTTEICDDCLDVLDVSTDIDKDFYTEG